MGRPDHPPRCLAQRDRLELCRLLEALGPDAPTLCAGWTARDLAAHLVARDHRPDSIPGLVLAPLSGWSERVRLRILERPYEELVATLRAGLPRWSPLRTRRGAQAFDTHEFFVHVEDVRRVQPGWEPRQLGPDDERDLWRVLAWFGPRAFRRVPVPVVLRRPDGAARRVARLGRSRRGPGGPATITGPPGELLLYAFGRRDQARVEVSGDEGAVRALASTHLSW
jgi:uncharacterized protein (TIGR03085 family)